MSVTRIFGAVREGERWRRRYNFELKHDFGEPDMVAVVKVRVTICPLKRGHVLFFDVRSSFYEKFLEHHFFHTLSSFLLFFL